MDWNAIRARLEQAAAAVGESSAQREAVLRRRAGQIARPLSESETLASSTVLLIFRAAGSRYALPLTAVAEIVAHAQPAAIPGAPPEIAGLIQLRGDIVPVIHLSRLLGTVSPLAGDTVLLVKAGPRTIGAAIEGIEEIRAIDPRELQPASSGSRHSAGTIAGTVTVLDPESLVLEEERWRT